MTREELTRFVASLKVPEERREVILAELLDHLESAAADGAAPALGDPAALRARLEAVEPAFAFGVRAGIARGAATLAGLLAAQSVLFALHPSLAVTGSPLVELVVEAIPPVVCGSFLALLLFILTPSAVWAQLAAAGRAGGFRRGWRWASPAERAAVSRASGAICYLATVLYGGMVAAFVIQTVTGYDDFGAPFIIPVVSGFLVLLGGSIRLRRRARAA